MERAPFDNSKTELPWAGGEGVPGYPANSATRNDKHDDLPFHHQSDSDAHAPTTVLPERLNGLVSSRSDSSENCD